MMGVMRNSYTFWSYRKERENLTHLNVDNGIILK
jgi:hypothetical protein